MAWNLRFKRKRDVPDGLWLKCPGCSQMVFKKQVEELLQVCPECNYHFSISAQERIRITVDEGSFQELYGDLEPVDFLNFADRKTYLQRIKDEQEKTGLKDACVVGRATIESHPVIFGVTDSRFLMGSMGAVVGEKIALAAEEAARRRLPLVFISGSGGGARMMEGVISLAQMAKTAAAIARLDDAGMPFISVLTNPTMGGVAASWAALGDIQMAEPKALIGFTGPRIIKLTLGIDLPEDFQSSEFFLEHGFVDMVVARGSLRGELGRLLGLLGEAGGKKVS